MDIPYKNGSRSSSILLMVFNFLQSHQRVKLNKTSSLNNLGALFLEFLDFYGSKLNDKNEVSIYTSNGGRYYEPILAAKNLDTSLVTACDTIRSSNSSSQPSFKYIDIKNILYRTYQALAIKLHSTELKYINIYEHSQISEPISILNIILTLSDKDIQLMNADNDLFLKMRLNMDDYVSKEVQMMLH